MAPRLQAIAALSTDYEEAVDLPGPRRNDKDDKESLGRTGFPTK